MEERTTRERIADRLRENASSPGALANEFGVTTASALDHVEHIAYTLDGTEEGLEVAPPECVECGFSAFEDPLNRPSRCPDCHAETVEEPLFRIQ